MAVETIDYNGYRLEVVPVGKGWRVSIYPPDSTLALRESPSIREATPFRTSPAQRGITAGDIEPHRPLPVCGVWVGFGGAAGLGFCGRVNSVSGR
jgi:hypothetical protein